MCAKSPGTRLAASSLMPAAVADERPAVAAACCDWAAARLATSPRSWLKALTGMVPEKLLRLRLSSCSGNDDVELRTMSADDEGDIAELPHVAQPVAPDARQARYCGQGGKA